MARAASFGTLPATGAGHLAIVDQGRQQWAFDFHPYHGDVKQLAPFDSSCRPTVQFVSSSEFVSFGCHGGNSPQVLGGFNMRGEEMWEQNLFSDFVALSFAFAPSSGRFALGARPRRLCRGRLNSDHTDAFTEQTVIVYQTESGKQILHVDCSPVARAGQNFALSPDGMKLAVIRENAVQIYTLPPLSTADQAEVKEARALVPHQDELPIDFAVSSAHPAAAAESEEPSSNAPENTGPVAAKADSPEAPESSQHSCSGSCGGSCS